LKNAQKQRPNSRSRVIDTVEFPSHRAGDTPNKVVDFVNSNYDIGLQKTAGADSFRNRKATIDLKFPIQLRDSGCSRALDGN
jgi:hypothetical protein